MMKYTDSLEYVVLLYSTYTGIHELALAVSVPLSLRLIPIIYTVKALYLCQEQIMLERAFLFMREESY